MSIDRQTPILLGAAVVVGGLGLLAWSFFGTDDSAAASSVKVPTLSAVAVAGRAAFDANCAQCHGKNASGTKLGPPLVNDIYNPGHHGDESFSRAAHQGVRQHHWHFGDMPPVPQVTDMQVAQIVRYVRELQEANGIFFRPHQM